MTHHPFETLVDISNALRKGEQTLSSELQNLLRRQLDLVKNIATRKVNNVIDGYQRTKALEAVHALEVILS
jgi:flagellar motility protein MotE (MotC chaperone)